MNKIKVWSLPVRVFHWALVSSFLYAMCTRDSELLRINHVYAGYVAGVAILARFVYGLLANDYAGFRRFRLNFRKAADYTSGLISGEARRYLGHNPAGAVAIYGMLLTGVVTITSGLAAFNFEDADLIKSVHHHAAWTWVALVGLHLCGVAVGSIAHRENLVWSMITGYKKLRIPNLDISLAPLMVSTLFVAIKLVDVGMVTCGLKGIVIREKNERHA